MPKSKYVTKTRAAGQQRVLNVRPDTPDIRDRYYAPAMLQLSDSVFNDGGMVLDQGTEGACTGFALAAVINLLNMKRGEAFSASPRMLYEMARKHDEWPGEDYQGSSCRGAIRGWRNMGVCSSRAWPYKPDSPGTLTIDRAMAARHNPLGAYYRLRPDVVDYHAALNEVDAIYVSARVHDGWSAPQIRDDYAVIQPGGEPTGGHAFALVGYNHLGFLVQNSWGEDWGKDGFAIWLYEDWQAHVSDGWVFRLGIATPTIFSLRPRPRSEPDEAELVNKGPKRHRIAGHFAHFDDGHYQTHGNYWTTAADLRQTARRLADNRDWYQHVLVFVHGGLNSPKSSARRIAALKDGFTRNRIYPLHIMYDTGLAEEIRDTLGRVSAETEERAEGFVDWVNDQIIERTDTLIEHAIRKPVTALWEEMKRDAWLPFATELPGGTPDGLDAIKIFADALKDSGLQFHLVGHSTGAVLIGHLLAALDTLKRYSMIDSCTLFAPACTLDFYDEHYAVRLRPNHRGTRLPRLDIFNLSKKLELDDDVVKVYRKSLLYLVSNALERERGKPILGIQEHADTLSAALQPNFIVSNGRGRQTRATTHGGFDNDPYTMNTLLTRILGVAPEEPFAADEMKGY